MTKIKKSRPGVSGTRTAVETGTVCKTASNSISHDTTAAAGRQIQIKDFLLTGAENAIPRRHLRQLTGLSDRDLRRQIQAARLAGDPILSSTTAGGYYLPADNAELEHFVRSMRGRSREIEAVAAAVEGAEIGELVSIGLNYDPASRRFYKAGTGDPGKPYGWELTGEQTAVELPEGTPTPFDGRGT